MSTLALEHELEGELESEAEALWPAAQESEHEQEAEHEAFFNHLAAMGDKRGRPQELRRIALAAARAALRGIRSPYPVIEGELEAPSLELELESTPSERAHYAAMMEHAGHAAAEAANEQEAAEHFLPLVGMAAKLVAPKLLSVAGKLGGKLLGKAGSRLVGRVGARALSRAAPRVLGRVAPRALGRVAPHLTRGLGHVTRTLYRHHGARPLLHAVPRIARGTMRSLVWNAARGRRLTPRFAVRQLARHTAHTLSDPRVLNQIYRRSLVMDRRFHRHTGRWLGRPTGRIFRVGGAWPTAGVAPLAPAWPGVSGGTCACRCACQQGSAVTNTVMTPVGPAPVAWRGGICPTCGR